MIIVPIWIYVFIYFGIVSSQRRRGWILGKRRTLILTTAAITDLSQEKLLYHMIYFGMTGGSPSFILTKASAGFFFALSFFWFFFWCAVENEVCHFFQCSSNPLFFFIRNMFFLDLRMLTEANINSAWQSVLPKRQDTKQALGTDAIAWRWSLPIFTNNALSDLSPFMI